MVNIQKVVHPPSPQRYVAAAIAAAVDNIRSAPEGSRNDTLNREAFSIGTLAHLADDPDDLAEALFRAGVDAGLPKHEASATVKSGFTAGQEQPREVGGMEPPPERGLERLTPSELGEPRATYIYRNEQNKAVLGVERYEIGGTKTFRQFTKRGGPKRYKTKDIRKVPYRLPEMLADADAIVWLAEGEKDCDTLAAFGLVATTNPGGATTWPDELTEHFRDRNLVILRDNDPAGAKRSVKLVGILHNVAATIRVIHFPELRRGGDVTDWLELGHTKEELLALAGSAPVVTPDSMKTALSTADDWEKPLDVFAGDELAGRPGLPPNALPPVIEAYAKDLAERLGVDPAMIAIPCLVVCAACLHDNYQIQPRVHDNSWTESARLWAALVEEAGGRKTPAIKAAIDPLYAIQARWAEEDEIDREKYDIDKGIYAKKLDAYIKARAKGAEATKPEQPLEFRPRRRIVSDATIEALSEILLGNTSGVLSHNDELTAWLGGHDAYRGKNTGRDRALWLEAYNGGKKPIDRVGRGSIVVPNWSVSILGGIQPGPIKKHVANLSDDGLLQRFVVIHGRSEGSGVDRPVNDIAVQNYRQMIERLTSSMTPEPVVTLLSPEAHQAREAILKVQEDIKILPHYPASLKTHINKWEALFARLLLTFHAVETTGTVGAGISKPANGETAARVVRLMVDYFLPHAVQFHTEVFGADDTMQDARWIAGHVLSRNLPGITAREIGRAYRKLRQRPKETEDAMMILERHDWVRRNHGRTKPSWDVNPMVHSIYAARAAQERDHREAEREKIRQATSELGLTVDEEEDC